MRYRLRDQVSFCWVGDRVVFLDLDRDRYFCLPPDAEAVFKALLNAKGEEVRDIDRLLELGLVERARTGESNRQPKSAATAQASLIDRAPLRGTCGPLTVLEVWARLLGARMALKHRPLRDVLARVSARGAKGAAGRSQTEARRESCESLAHRFNFVRRRTPLAQACLPDALALLDFLAARRIYADLVFGVRLNPFGAHCWVQSADVVLNDGLDRTLVHSPILAV